MDHRFKCKSNDLTKSIWGNIWDQRLWKKYIGLFILKALIINIKLISYSSSKEKHMLCDKSVKRIKITGYGLQRNISKSSIRQSTNL